ncbi:putative nucleotide-diphospho-sugar transferase [Salipiger sp. 1_MG-2023]|uniref:putative nucleotide-diphospho-sugar transferase n=1 Tax=Salipiger sp. 1_MG-2023 TaxID=3062665 RepID=UPI0026E233AA|nr:putative nucleotide-diphospho-sugar transferase [Salipiger sp. 1_MG-2023]MDO6585926.1 putative nucleotide-diphospho-sugar transferase [Salipiger sp. 1_MG-2023]
MTPEFEIITCADAQFYEILRVFERNIHAVMGRYPTVFDLGLTDAQKASIKSPLVSIDVAAEYNQINADGYIRTTHKPTAIAHVLNAGQPCLYLDADMLLTEAIVMGDFLNADLAVTPRHPDELSNDDLQQNGKINAGFLYFSGSEASRAVLERWRDLCASSEFSDQRAMSEVLKGWSLDPSSKAETRDGLSLARLDPRVFNDTGRRTGKVLHFKNLGRRSRKRREWLRWARWIRLAPGLVRGLVRYRRKQLDL